MNNKNILWINLLKAICIIGVFWVHSANYFGVSTPLGSYIHPYYVNGFFFISGYLLFRKQLSEPLIGQKVAEYRRGGV